MSALTLENVSKTFPRTTRPAVDGISFTMKQGEILALVGESGSGKTTLLRLISGLETPDSGTITLEGHLLADGSRSVAPEKRGVGMVFQHHALFPHLRVEDNIGFGLRRLPARQRKEEVAQLLTLINLPTLGKRYPHELSGGERQRVALARALATQPGVLLLDEPFSNLDPQLRQNLRDETRRILREHKTTAIFVTHDTRDALAVADRIAVFFKGKLRQLASPQEVYHAPANPYVAALFGLCNFLPLNALHHPSGVGVRCHIGPPAEAAPATHGGGLWVRPENLELVPIGKHPGEFLQGEVVRVVFQGDCHDVTLTCLTQEGLPFDVKVRHHTSQPVHPGERWVVIPKPR